MLYFKVNVPGWERMLRIAAGVAVAILAALYANMPAVVWIGIAGGLMFALTGLVGFCPMCALAGRKPAGSGS
jgi:hypothetical protein